MGTSAARARAARGRSLVLAGDNAPLMTPIDPDVQLCVTCAYLLMLRKFCDTVTPESSAAIRHRQSVCRCDEASAADRRSRRPWASQESGRERTRMELIQQRAHSLRADDVIAGTDEIVPRLTHQRPRLEPAQFPRLLREHLEPFGHGLVAWSRDRLGGPDDIHVAPLMWLVHQLPWPVQRVVLIDAAAYATTPHVGCGAGLAVEDGMVLAEEIARTDDLETALSRFSARRFERCRMVVEGGVCTSAAGNRAESPMVLKKVSSRTRSGGCSPSPHDALEG